MIIRNLIVYIIFIFFVYQLHVTFEKPQRQIQTQKVEVVYPKDMSFPESFYNDSANNNRGEKVIRNERQRQRKRRDLDTATTSSNNVTTVGPEDMVRKFRTTYANKTWVEIKKRLDHYFQINLMYYAGNDSYNYSYLLDTDFETAEQRAMYFYKVRKLEKYQVDFPNPSHYKIMMKVDPCKNKGIDNDLCCDGSNEAVCEDNTSIISGTDIGVAWLTTGYVMTCSDSYKDLGTCGTFIEIHKPNNETIEEDLQITSTISSGFKTEFISTKNLCAGRYEFWLVLRTRNGSILQHVKPFYSEYPACTSSNSLNTTTGTNTTNSTTNTTTTKTSFTQEDYDNLNWRWLPFKWAINKFKNGADL